MKLACFLKVKRESTRRGCQNHAIVQSFNHVLSEQKIAREKFQRSGQFLSFEGKRIDLEQANRYLGGFSKRYSLKRPHFVTKTPNFKSM